MSLEPSQPPTESTPHEPPGENERKTLKPGKGYGLASLRYGLAGPLLLLALLSVAWNYWFGLVRFGYIEFSWLTAAVNSLFIVSPYFVIAGIVSGIWGLNTEGRVYACIGIVLSIIYGAFVFVNIVNVVFFRCC